MSLKSLSTINYIKIRFNEGYNKIKKTLYFLIKDVILVWPRACFIALPLLSRDIKTLWQAKHVFTPQVIEVASLASIVFSRIVPTTQKIQEINTVVTKLVGLTEGLSSDQVLASLEKLRFDLEQIQSFIFEILAPDEDDLAGDTKEFVPELAKTSALLNALIDDLSSRGGVFTTAKKSAGSGSLVAAKAEAVSIKGDQISPIEAIDSPLNLSGIVSDEIAPLPVISRKGPDKSKVSSLPLDPKIKTAVILKPTPLKTPVRSQSEIHFLKQAQGLGTDKKMTFINHAASFIHFLAVDIFLGIPKFFIYDLPHKIIQVQNATGSMIAKIHPCAKFLIEFKDVLKALEALMQQIDKLGPVAKGVQLYLSKNFDSDLKNLKQNHDLIIGGALGSIESIDTEQLRSIKKGMKDLLFKINPLLTDVLNTLEGRSLFSALTSRRKSPTTPAGAGDTSTVTSATSGSEPSKIKEGGPSTPSKLALGIGQLIKGISSGLATPPPGAGAASKP